MIRFVTETEDRSLKSFRFVFKNPGDEEKFAYTPGQFGELSIAGKGEIPIGIASSPTEKGFVLFTVNKVGLVSSLPAQHEGRRRHGNPGTSGQLVSLKEMEGKNVVIIGGGFAFTTLRSSISLYAAPG